VSGELLVKVGFVPLAAGPATAPPTPNSSSAILARSTTKESDVQLSDADRTRLLDILRRVAEEDEGTRRASKEERVLLSPPTEGVGMHPISDVAPLGETSALEVLEDDLSSGSDTDGAETDSEASTSSEDDDNERAIAETSTDDEDAISHPAIAADYFGSATLAPLSTDGPPSQPGSKPLSPVLEPGAEPVTVPDIVVGQDEITPVSTPTGPGLVPASAIPPSRRGLSLPGFLRRNSSSRSVASASVSGGEGTAAESAEAGVARAGRHKVKRRFSRKKAGDVDGDVSGEASSSSVARARAPKLSKRHRRKHRAERQSDASAGAGAGAGDGTDKSKRKKLGKRRTSHYTYENDNDDVLGLVQIEINSANLPRFSNMFKTGFDCDP